MLKSEVGHGFSSTLHVQYSGVPHSCTLTGDPLQRPYQVCHPHIVSFETSPRVTQPCDQPLSSLWPGHPRSAPDIKAPVTGHASYQANVKMETAMIRFGRGGTECVKLATLLGIPLSPDWGKNTFPSVARQIGKHAETLALHSCDESLADEIKAAVDSGVTPEMVGGGCLD